MGRWEPKWLRLLGMILLTLSNDLFLWSLFVCSFLFLRCHALLDYWFLLPVFDDSDPSIKFRLAMLSFYLN